jgi:hypothetical protein
MGKAEAIGMKLDFHYKDQSKGLSCEMTIDQKARYKKMEALSMLYGRSNVDIDENKSDE